jgi:hypothetical protein
MIFFRRRCCPRELVDELLGSGCLATNVVWLFRPDARDMLRNQLQCVNSVVVAPQNKSKTGCSNHVLYWLATERVFAPFTDPSVFDLDLPMSSAARSPELRKR